jgi:hypothetical protein
VGGDLEQSSAVQAVVHRFGQCDLLASGSRSAVEARLVPFAFEAGLLGVSSLVEAADRARALSLLTRVSCQAPPFLIAHGDRDHVVGPSEGQALHDALSRAGADTSIRPRGRRRSRGTGVLPARRARHDSGLVASRAHGPCPVVMRRCGGPLLGRAAVVPVGPGQCAPAGLTGAQPPPSEHALPARTPEVTARPRLGARGAARPVT